MHTKLTLTVENGVIRQAKGYARARRTSLSRLVQSYFSSLSVPFRRQTSLPPITASLAGMVRGAVADEKKVLGDALAEKFL
jgi:hypothetical protein